MVVSRGVVGSAVCGRAFRGSLEAEEEAKRPPPIRQTVPILGEDMGDRAAESLKVSAGMGAVDAGSGRGCDGESASKARRWALVDACRE